MGGGGQQSPGRQNEEFTRTQRNEPWESLVPYLLQGYNQAAGQLRGRVPGFQMPAMYNPETGRYTEFPTMLAPNRKPGQGGAGWPALGNLDLKYDSEGKRMKGKGKTDMRDFLWDNLPYAPIMEQIKPGAFAMPIDPNTILVSGPIHGLNDQTSWRMPGGR